MLSAFVLVAAAVAAPPASDPAWESYACEGGPPVRLALIGGRPAERGFLALETWGNDNVSFPGECYKRYVEELYRKDALVAGGFSLGGHPIHLSQITCPTLAVTFEHDNIVPWPSAAELIDQVGAADKQRIHLPGGHVGAVVSQKASKTLWPQISAFWAARDAEPKAG